MTRAPYRTPLRRFIERIPPAGYRDLVFTFDIDNTYLVTPTGSIRDLLAAAATSTRNRPRVAGANALLREVRRGRPGAGPRPVYFVSASPVQLRGRLQDRFRRDRIGHDGITLKDPVAHLARGRLGGVTEQVGFKLAALLLARADYPGGAREVLVGDDADADPLAYALYAALVSGRLAGRAIDRVLTQAGVDRRDREYVATLAETVAAGAAPGEVVTRILVRETGFVSMSRPSERAQRALPPRLRTAGGTPVLVRDHLQSGLVLWADGVLDDAALGRLARAVGREDGTGLAADVAVAASLLDAHRRGLLAAEPAGRVEGILRGAKLLPPAFRFEP